MAAGGPNLVEAPGSPFGVAYATTVLAAGDFNGDGKLDLVGGSGFSNGFPITIYLNNGNGTFTSNVSFNTGFGTGVITTGDFNGDGKQDLAFTHDNAIGVLLGNGNGTFGPAASYLVGNNPGAMTAGDFNGDGKQDLAVINNGFNGLGSTLTILMANPIGTFGSTFLTAPSLPLGKGATDVKVGDFNHDGKLVLVVTNAGDNDIEVFLGNGNGTFGPGATFAAGPSPSQIAVADFNGDGKLDLVINNPGSNTLTVLLGNGDGTFRNPESYAAGLNPAAPAVVDLNGDGVPDLLVADAGFNTLYMLLGNGDGTFAAAPAISTPTYPGSSLLISDLNGDGTPDVVSLMARWYAFALLNQPLTGTATAPVAPAPSGSATHFVVSAPTNSSAGAAFTATIIAEDSSNNTATSYFGTVNFVSSDTQATLPANTMLNSGMALFSATLKTAGSQTLEAVDAIHGNIAGVSNAIAIGAGTAARLALSGLPKVLAPGGHFSFTVTAEDPFNNTATGYRGNMRFLSSDPGAVLPAYGLLTSGVGIFSATLQTLGSQTLIALGAARRPQLGPGPRIAF